LLIQLNTHFSEVGKVNPFVTKYKVYAISSDTIANKFLFNHDVVDKMKTTLMSSPIVTAFINNDDGSLLGGHADDIIKVKGRLQRTPETTVVGYVLDSEPYFEEYNGKEWLVCEANIWDNRFPGLKNMSKRDIWQSLELNLDTQQEGDIKKVTSAMVTALCILENVKPAFTGSTFEKFSIDDYQSEIDSLKQELQTNDNSIPLKGGENEDMYGLTAHQLRGRLQTALSVFKYITGECENNKYYIDDFSASLVFVEDYEEGGYYSIAYQLIEGKCVLDMLTKIPVEEGYTPITFSKHNKNSLYKDTFSEGSKKMKDFKALYSSTKASQSKFAFDDSIDPESDESQITILLDMETNCLYIMDDCGCVTKIPFMTIDDDDDTFALKEDAKETLPSGKEMMSKMSQMFAVEKEKVTTEMSAKLSAKEAEMSEALLSKDAELSAKDSEIGKSFASITSMESAMAETATVMAERDAKIAELSEQLKGKETAEKMSQVEEFLNGKEFSVFSAEEKQTFKDKSNEMSLDEFKDMTYSVFGKKVKDKIDFSTNTQKFSFMHVDTKQPDTKEEKDVYADIREKNNNNK